MLDRAKVREVFAEALALSGEQVGVFLDRECGQDAALRAEVESLLAAAAQRPGFMGAAGAGGPVEGPGTTIGPYRLVEEIGQGGFGSVYAAEQLEPVKRRVAIKIIKLGMDTRAVIARFEAERQALAMMDHANIARVLDAGATASGRPYFVMELVTGEPITTYCDSNNLSISERLDVFVQVCHAVQHAHSKGVIHRDIKPGNVLVATEDGKPHAKVIDFGIAKATDQRSVERTHFTKLQEWIGTPAYMSPEQAGGASDVDTRSDVYSLGVLLYELLTGEPPFDPESLRSAAYGEIQRIIREVEPPKPSTRLSRLNTLASVAASRRTEPGRLGALVCGDLDWIVMKALEKDRGRRYETPGALAADVLRHKRSEPVVAAPPRLGYRASRFVRRNRMVVAAFGVVIGVLVLGIAGTTWGMLSAWHARRVAQSERDLAATVRTFLAETFEGVSPQVARGRDTELLGALMDNAAARIEAGELAGNRAAERELRYVIASVYDDIARYDDARAVLRPFERDPEGLAAQDIRLLLLRADLAITGSDIGSAESLLLEAQRRLDRSHDQDPRLRSDVFAVLARLAFVQRLFDQAEGYGNEAVRSARAVQPPAPEMVAHRLHKLGIAVNNQGREDDALAHWDEALHLLDRPEYEYSPVRVDLLNSRAVVYAQRLNADRARQDSEEALRVGRRIFAAPHPSMLVTRLSLANILIHAGMYEEAMDEFDASLALTRTIHGNESLEAAPVLESIAEMHFMFGRHEQALEAALECEAIRERHLSPKSLAAGGSWTTAVNCLRALGRNDEALQRARQGVEAQQQFLDPASENALAGQMALMYCLLYDCRYDETAEVGRALLDTCERSRSGSPPIWLHDAQLVTAIALLAMPEPTDAPAAERLSRACLVERERRFGDRDVRVATARLTLGQALAVQLQRSFSASPAGNGPEDRAAMIARFGEVEALLAPSFQSQIEALATIAAPVRRVRIEGPAESFVLLYEAWHRAEPGAGKAEVAAEWRNRLAEARALVGEHDGTPAR